MDKGPQTQIHKSIWDPYLASVSGIFFLQKKIATT